MPPAARAWTWAVQLSLAVGLAQGHTARPAMHYFRRWFDAAIEAALARDGGRWASEPGPGQLGEMLRRHRSGVCPEDAHAMAFDAISSEMGQDGAHRAVIRLADGQLHFLASAGGRMLVVDPPLRCVASSRRLDYRKGGEEEELLHCEDDHLVQDCMRLFRRESEHHCGFQLAAEPLSAKLEVTEGFEVRVHARVSKVGALAEPAYHLVVCEFEPAGAVPTETPRAAREETREETSGMVATVMMHVGLCGASSINPETIGALRLFEAQGGSGELSHVKGYRHVYDGVPRFLSGLQVKAQVDLPIDIDLRKAHARCFPPRVVREQGQCGSCWAFAAASSFMANVCIAGRGAGALDPRSERYEVSVQRIISCNVEGFGCHGGHAVAAGATIGSHLPAKERDVPYLCGGGSSLDHFTVASTACDARPWGGTGQTCDRSLGVGSWHYGGVTSLDGETEMMNALSEGRSLFVSMGVYENFMTHRGGIYDRIAGENMGVHAMVALGYGQEYTRKRYWWVQNSWGPGWGDGGYVKILRGENLADIERQAMYIAGWPEGFEPPDRSVEDRFATALSSAGIPVDTKTIGAIAMASCVVLLGICCSLLRCLTNHERGAYAQMMNPYVGDPAPQGRPQGMPQGMPRAPPPGAHFQKGCPPGGYW